MATEAELAEHSQVTYQRTIESLFARPAEQRTPSDYLRWVFSGLNPETDSLPAELLRTPTEYLTVQGQDENFTNRAQLINYLSQTQYIKYAYELEEGTMEANIPDAFEFAVDGLFSLARSPSSVFYFSFTSTFRNIAKEKFAAELALLHDNKISSTNFPEFLAHTESDFLRIKALCNAIVSNLPTDWSQINTLENGSDPTASNKYEGALAHGCKARDILTILANIHDPNSIFQFMGKLLHTMNEPDAYKTGITYFDQQYEAARHNAAKFAMYIFAPMADLMNLPELYRALIDSALKVLDPDEYAVGKVQRDEALAIQVAPLAQKIGAPEGFSYPFSKAAFIAAFFEDYFTAGSLDKSLKTRIKSVFSYMRKKSISDHGTARNFDDIFAMRLETQLDRNPKISDLPSLSSEVSAIIFDITSLTHLQNTPGYHQEIDSEIGQLMEYLKFLLNFFSANYLAYTGETLDLEFAGMSELREKLLSFYKRHPNANLGEFIRNLELDSEETLYTERINLTHEIATALLPLTQRKSILVSIEEAAGFDDLFDYFRLAQDWLELSIRERQENGTSAIDFLKISRGTHLQKTSPYKAIHGTIDNVELSVVTAIPAAIYNAHHFSYKHKDHNMVAPAARLALLTAQQARVPLHRTDQLIPNVIEEQLAEYTLTKQVYSGISAN